MLFVFFVYRIISIEKNDRGLFFRWLNDLNIIRIANRDLNLAFRTHRYERAPLVRRSETWRLYFFFVLLSTWPKNKTHYRQPWRRSSSGRRNGTKPGVKRRWAKEQRRRNERGSWVVVVKEQVDNKCAMEANDKSRSGWRNGCRRRKMGETRGLSNRGRLARDRFESFYLLPPLL